MSVAQQQAAASASAPRPPVVAAPLGAPQEMEAAGGATAAHAAPGAAAATAASAAEDSWAVAGSCPRQFWAAPAETQFKVRGPNYVSGDKKKIPAGPPAFELVAVDLLELEEPMFDVARFLPSIQCVLGRAPPRKAGARAQGHPPSPPSPSLGARLLCRQSPAPFLFVVQLMVPASPPISLVATWAAPMAIFGRSAAELMGEYEAQQGAPPPPSVAAFFRAITE